MSFLKTVAEEEAEGEVAVNYHNDIERVAYLPNTRSSSPCIQTLTWPGPG
ncbi:MAG: hypothetical protein ACRDXF_12410 [Acidimicrobiia bacterium]